ncbi:MNIO family bufferin maturase [Kaarinaea lacus]
MRNESELNGELTANRRWQNDANQLQFLGFGLGLRTEYYDTILQQQPNVDWFEILTENYMVDGGKPLYYLDAIGERYPMVMHGVSLSIGGTDPLDTEYLAQLKKLAQRVQPHWISDHLCWTGQGGHNLHDLMPLPYNEEAIKHVADRVRQVQDFLGRQILLENVSSHVTYKHSAMCEWEFYRAVVEEADCLMLLDINNIYVSARNHRFEPSDYLTAMPKERVQQMHLAGHTDCGNYVIDTHDHPVVDLVWQLYEEALKRFGPVSTMIERDDRFPPFNELMQELEQARAIGESILGKAA